MKQLFSITAILLLASVLHAQAPLGSMYKKSPQQQKELLILDAKLSDIQADSVVTIYQSFSRDFRAIFQNQNLTREQKKEQAQALHEKEKARIVNAIGEDAAKRVTELHKQHTAVVYHNKDFNNTSRQRERLVHEVGLTDVQADSVIKVRNVYMPQIATIRNNETITDEERKAQANQVFEAMNLRMEAAIGVVALDKLRTYQKERSKQMRDNKAASETK